MKRFLILICALVLTVSAAPHCSADLIPLTVDTTNSFLNLSIAGQPAQQSQASGTATIDLSAHSATSGNAQLTTLDLTLDDQLTFTNIPITVGGFITVNATASTTGGDLTVSLLAPGAPGAITGGTFDQLANQVGFTGDVTVSAPLVAPMVFDLSTVTAPPVDFISVNITQSGSVITVTGDFEVSAAPVVAGNVIAIEGEGQFVATGILEPKPTPEPGSTMVLIGMASVLFARRRR